MNIREQIRLAEIETELVQKITFNPVIYRGIEIFNEIFVSFCKQAIYTLLCDDTCTMKIHNF